jgi:hypothetical protein
MGGEKKSSSFHQETALLLRRAWIPYPTGVPGFRISRLPLPHGSVVPGGFMSLRGLILFKQASG